MKILHISSALTWRGGERQVKLLMEGLKKRGVESYLMSPAGSELSQRSDLDASHLIDYHTENSGWNSLNVGFLRRFCESHKIDIVHGHDSHAHGKIWKSYLFGGLKTKSIVTRRLLNPIKWTSRSKYNDKRIQKIICISEAVREVLSKNIKDRSRLEMIHSGINIEQEDKMPRSLPINKERVIGYVAAFTKEKKHTEFIKIARNLVSIAPNQNFKFLLVGEGPLRKSIQKESQDIRDHIIFTGFVEDVIRMYDEIDILLHTSASEALGTAVLDAMKEGIPVVAADVGGVPEMVENGKNGFLYPSGNIEKASEVVLKLTGDNSLYQAMSNFGKIKAKEFDVDKMIEKTLEVYKNL